jgi:hypothetical protein
VWSRRELNQGRKFKSKVFGHWDKIISCSYLRRAHCLSDIYSEGVSFWKFVGSFKNYLSFFPMRTF